ncbi:hypothetical protein JRQ81_004475 [Phrynocephalus forsythii]|uniref:Uncharacterized protein n=1 Tax=Phrynocephalus forsythii TaxID=171643 RepID=A0A9Q1AUX1_9SAUR|nr:hypothetical protein JRQ81_004475 [Phrynocephalus forsythii]
MFASSSRGGPAPAGRGAAGGGGGKFSVDDLYGLPKKSKGSRGESVRRKNPPAQGSQVGRDGPEVTAAQMLEVARRLIEKRRVESYLLEAGLGIEELETNRTAMRYSQSSGFQGENWKTERTGTGEERKETGPISAFKTQSRGQFESCHQEKSGVSRQ